MKDNKTRAEGSAPDTNTPSATYPEFTAQNQFVAEPIEENGQTDNADTLTFSDDVIEKIAGEAASQAEGVAGLRGGFFNRVQETFGAKTNKGVAVEVEDDGSVALYISIVMRFGYYAPDVFEDVKTRVLEAISQMTGLQIASVNLRIEDIAAPSDAADKPAEEPANTPATAVADKPSTRANSDSKNASVG